MDEHAPPGYDCPFCRLAHGEEEAINSPRFTVCEDDGALAFIAPKWWINSAGHILVISKERHENSYAIPDRVLAHVSIVSKRIAIAMRQAYPCEGTSTRQHNEPSGNQDVWHFHIHIFPRYTGDALYLNQMNTRWATAAERIAYADRLRAHFATTGPEAAADALTDEP